MIVTAPDLFLWVKNRIEIACDYEETTAHTVKVQLLENDVILCEGTYSTRAGVATIDISGYAKDMFDLLPDDRVLADYAMARRCETLRRMYVRVINDSNEIEYDQEHFFIYGEKLISDTLNFPDYYFPDAITGTTFTHFMTGFERPKMFKDYPFELRFGAYHSGGEFDELDCAVYLMDRTGVLFSGAEINLDTGFSSDLLKLKLYEDVQAHNDRTAYMIVAGNLEYIYPIFVDYITDMIPGGIYLRWINRFGGMDQYYFYLRDTRRPVKSSVVTLAKRLDYTNNHNQGIVKPINKEYATQYVLGVDGATTADFIGISGIAISDRVDMYMGSGKWVQVIVSDTDFNLDHDKDFHDIEITITAE